MPIDLNGYQLILGSKSPYRLKLLQEAGYSAEVVTADIDEKGIGNRNDPKFFAELPLEIARAKRDAILKVLGVEKRKVLLITCDQVSIYGDCIFEKPRDKQELEQRLRLLIENIPQLQFRNGMTITNLWTGEMTEETDSSFAVVRKMSEEALSKILANDIFLTCASGIMIEHELYAGNAVLVRGRLDSNIGLNVYLFEKLAIRLVT